MDGPGHRNAAQRHRGRGLPAVEQSSALSGRRRGTAAPARPAAAPPARPPGQRPREGRLGKHAVHGSVEGAGVQRPDDERAAVAGYPPGQLPLITAARHHHRGHPGQQRLDQDSDRRHRPTTQACASNSSCRPTPTAAQFGIAPTQPAEVSGSVVETTRTPLSPPSAASSTPSAPPTAVDGLTSTNGSVPAGAASAVVTGSHSNGPPRGRAPASPAAAPPARAGWRRAG